MGCTCYNYQPLCDKEYKLSYPNTNLNTKSEETKKNQIINLEKPKEEKSLKNKNNCTLTSFTEKNINLERMRELELAEHNRLRNLHGSPPLILNNELNEMAQNYAQILAQRQTLQHSKNRNLKGKEGEYVGENLYYFSAYPVLEYKCGSMSESWYEEIKDYDFNTGKSKNGGVVGHFTQLIWKNTKEVGFGIGFNGNILIAVANYYPGGNFNDEELKNVGKLKN